MAASLKGLRALVFACALAAPLPALATNGYFEIGYGTKALGMGGAGVAFPQDSIAAATNPAGMAFVGNRADLDVEWFRPDRDAVLGPVRYDGDDTQNFFNPGTGINYMLNPRTALGLSIFGNGGMNTDYSSPIPAFGTSDAGVDLAQLFVAPTLAYKLSDHHAVGISPIFAFQRFRAKGLENFGIEDSGHEDAYGGGVRVGYTGQFYDWLSVGATYQSPIWMSDFANYDNLFAEHGNFDVPANFAFGLAVKPHRTVTVAFDVEEILYGTVPAVGHDMTMERMGAGLGSTEGPGFGWENMTVLKLGIAWDVTPNLTLRAGYNYGKQPIPADQTLFNILAPGIVEHHLTFGLTWKVTNHLELSAFYMHAFQNDLHGSGNLGGADAELEMREDAAGIGLGWLF